MKRNAPPLRTALQLQHRLAQRHAGPQRERQRLWSEVQEHAQVVLRRLLLTHRAQSKQWFAAARITEISTLDALQQLRHVISNATPQLEIRTAPRAVSLGDLYQDLEQLDNGVRCDHAGTQEPPDHGDDGSDRAGRHRVGLVPDRTVSGPARPSSRRVRLRHRRAAAQSAGLQR